MPEVVRLKEIVDELETIDTLYVNGKYFTDIYKVLEGVYNPLVHIDKIEEYYEEGTGAYGTTKFLACEYYVTILEGGDK